MGYVPFQNPAILHNFTDVIELYDLCAAEVCIAGMTFVLSNYQFNLELFPLHVNHYGVTIAA